MPKTPGLWELRKRAALSQEELAEASGTSRATIADLEAGNRGAWPQTIRRLAEALHADPEDLYAEPDPPKAEAPPSAEQPPLNGFLAEERREEEELAVASMTAVAEEGERLEEELKEAVGKIPVGALYQFIAAHNLARLLYEEWSRDSQVSAELTDAKERLDAVGKRMDPLIHQLIQPKDAALARERDQFANVRAEWKRQEAERQAELDRKDATA